MDADGICDLDDVCPEDPDPACACADKDRDYICDQDDFCKFTVIPEVSVPAISLWYNRYALVDGDPVFDTGGLKGQPAPRIYTLEDTRGCSCEQIIQALGLGQGMIDHGCSISTMEYWIFHMNK
ncbi:hypothetical protein [Polyangium sp. y55x31]|uniref:hypothetical protein n=1 Tax=Polyangium sp. y55x31 TaxID=3042688 RepID=UPI00248242A2|nr:hypothetical protein [Polyangium sp. y55x31]MDI1480458.1 hypothetical protein [Polyangium sp. y55x31]